MGVPDSTELNEQLMAAKIALLKKIPDANGTVSVKYAAAYALLAGTLTSVDVGDPS